MAVVPVIRFFDSSFGVYAKDVQPLMPFFVIVPVIIAALPFAAIRGETGNWKEKIDIKSSLAIMPAYWVVIGLWGSAFAHRSYVEDGKRIATEYPAYINYICLMFLAVFFIYAVYRVYKNKGHRIFSSVYTLINAYFVLFITFIAGMSMSGTWL